MEKKPNTNYFYAMCKACDEDGTMLIEGRVRTLENHLKSCKPYLESELVNAHLSNASVRSSNVSVASFTSKRSKTSLTSSNLKKAKTTSITSFLDRALTPNEEDLLNQRIIEMIADNGMSFNWIERPSTRRFFEALRPASIHCMPSRRKLSGKLLRDAAKSSRDDILPKMANFHSNFKCNYFFVCDGWVDVSKRHILGSIVALLNLWFAYDESLGKGNLITDDRHDGLAVAQQIEKAFIKTENDFGITFGGVTTDEVGQCQRCEANSCAEIS